MLCITALYAEKNTDRERAVAVSGTTKPPPPGKGDFREE
jgi:hypothetical protein